MGVVLVAFSFTGFSGLEDFLVASGKDGLFFTGKFVSWGDVADRRVKAHGVVVFDEAGNQATGVLEVQGDPWADAITLKGFVPALDFSVALGVVGRGAHMGQTGDADKLFEIAGNELRTVIGDDSRFGVGIFFQAALEDDFDVGLSHCLAQFPVDDCARTAVEQRAEVEKGPGDVDVGDIDVPVLMRGKRLHEAGAFKRGLRLPGVQQPRALEHAIGARGAHRHDVAIQHHEGKPAIALQREPMVEVDDGILFPLLEPVITGNQDVVFVGLAVAIPPLVILGAGEFHPAHQAQRADLGAGRKPLDEIDDIVTGVVGNPASA